MYQEVFHSPLGLIIVEANDLCVTGISFSEKGIEANPNRWTTEIIKQLKEYFAGERFYFSVPLLISGTPFAQKVYETLITIPYGETWSYKAVATKIGNPKAVRAVGNANHKNPLAIVVPCHRVIGANGKLVGYGGGLDKKAWLLEHERKGLKRA